MYPFLLIFLYIWPWPAMVARSFAVTGVMEVDVSDPEATPIVECHNLSAKLGAEQYQLSNEPLIGEQLNFDFGCWRLRRYSIRMAS